MSDKTVKERVVDIIVDLLEIDLDESGTIADASSFRDNLDADSLDLVELIMAFEEEFGGEISDEQAQQITTVGQAVKYIEQHLM